MKTIILILSLLIAGTAALAFASEIGGSPKFWVTLAQVGGFIFCMGIIGKILDVWIGKN